MPGIFMSVITSAGASSANSRSPSSPWSAANHLVAGLLEVVFQYPSERGVVVDDEDLGFHGVPPAVSYSAALTITVVPLTGLALHLQRAVVGLDDLPGDGKTQAGAVGLVVKNGSKTLARASAPIPGPVSRKRISQEEGAPSLPCSGGDRHAPPRPASPAAH